MHIQDEDMSSHLGVHDLFLDFDQLVSRFLDRPMKPVHLALGLICFDPFLGQTDFRPFDQEGFAENDPRRGPDPMDPFIRQLLDRHR
jgi:hypothetical protein